MDKNQFYSLLDSYLEGRATPAEKILLEAYYQKLEAIGIKELGVEEEKVLKELLYGRVERAIRPPVVRMWKRWAVAASILLLLGLGWYFLFFEPKNTNPALTKTTDIEAPKVTKAMIRLADGRMISLDSLTTFTQDGVTLLKDKDGKIIYSPLVSPAETDEIFNVLTNPRGSKVVNLTLGDGTKVWLNSESSLKYPIAFKGNQRKVEITGEAYFEVSKDPTKKFIVSGNGVTTEVLGTHFNVHTYDNANEITLLEGSVKVNGTTITPGKQARVIDVVRVVDVDTDEVMAWKNGIFNYTNQDISVIMRDIARWYDVEIVYDGQKPADKFSGIINRSNNVSQVLKMLEQTNRVHFTIEARPDDPVGRGKKIRVRP